MTLGQKIRDMRKQMGISQEVLGEILNVSRQAITKWETDAGVPEVYNLSELAKLFGVPVDYFLSDKTTTDVATQLTIDITKYRNNNEENIQIIRHFYSEEWEAKYLKYTMYPKNKLVRVGLGIANIFSEFAFDAIMGAQLVYEIDKLDDNYYILYRNDMFFLAYINKDRLEVKNISNIKIKNPTIFNNKKHFAYDNKMFSIYNIVKAKNYDNRKNFKNLILFSILAIVIALVIGLLFILLSMGYIL